MRTTPSTRSPAGFSLLFSLLVTPVGAQESWSFETRLGGAVQIRELEDDLGAGFGLDSTIGYRIHPHLGAYVGWGWMHFGVAESFAKENVDYEETAFTFGLRFQYPSAGDGGTTYWVRAGGAYGHVELEDSDGERFADSGHGMGWEVGAGLALGFLRARVTPGLRFRKVSMEAAFAGEATEVGLRYVAAEIGVRFPI